MKIFRGKYIIIEKYTPPDFEGHFFTTWRNKEGKIIKIMVHKSKCIDSAFLHFNENIHKDITWILPAKILVKKRVRRKNITPEARLFWAKVVGQNVM